MKRYIFLFILLIGVLGNAQNSYVVDIDNRNMALDLLNVAKERIDENKSKEAIKILLKTVSIDSVLRDTYLLIYQTWLADKDLKDTVVYALQIGRKIFKNDDELCFYLAEIHRYSFELPEAIFEYTNATNYARQNGEDFYLVHYYYFNRANCFMKMDMYDGALHDYDYTIKLKPEFTSAYYNRGVCYFKKGDKARACADWERATQLGCKISKQYFDTYCKH